MKSEEKIAPKYVLFTVVALTGLVLDLWTKQIIVDSYRLGQSTVVYESFFSITYARNYGAAFSMFKDLPDGARSLFFGAVTVTAVTMIAWFMRQIGRKDYWLAFGLALIFSGAVGNAVDRWRYGYVVDFLDFYWGKGGPTWPTFNVADIGITAGAVMVFIFELMRKEEPASSVEQATA